MEQKSLVLEIVTSSGAHNPMFRGNNGDQIFDTGLRGDSSDNWCVYDVTNADNRFMIDPSGNVKIPNDSVEFSVGAGNDLKLYHSSGDSYITNSDGNLNVINSTDGWIRLLPKTGEEGVIVKPNGAVELYYNNVNRLSTNSTGAIVNGNNGNIFKATCSTNSTASVVFENTEANTAGDMRLLIKTAANQGSDPFIKFDAGGNDMIVGLHYLGTTNNELRLGAGTAVHTVNGITVNGNGNVFMNALNSGSGHSDLRYNTSTKQVFFDSSTRLVKTDIEDCSYGLAEINQLKPRIYKRTDADNVVEIGFVADEVQSILPEIVATEVKSFFTKDESDTEVIPSNVDLKRLTVVMTKAIQELASKVAALEAA